MENGLPSPTPRRVQSPLPKWPSFPPKGEPAHVFTRPFGSGNAHWSPDGKGLQFLLTRHGVSNIWEQPLAGGQPHPVTDFTSGHIFAFMWSRDGKQLLLAETSDVVLLSNFR
jgi:Tol biopolymer transport system component